MPLFPVESNNNGAHSSSSRVHWMYITAASTFILILLRVLVRYFAMVNIKRDDVDSERVNHEESLCGRGGTSRLLETKHARVNVLLTVYPGTRKHRSRVKPYRDAKRRNIHVEFAEATNQPGERPVGHWSTKPCVLTVLLPRQFLRECEIHKGGARPQTDVKGASPYARTVAT